MYASTVTLSSCAQKQRLESGGRDSPTPGLSQRTLVVLLWNPADAFTLHLQLPSRTFSSAVPSCRGYAAHDRHYWVSTGMMMLDLNPHFIC